MTESFRASIGNGYSGYLEVESDGGRVVWRGDRRTGEEHERTPTPHEWSAFWAALDRAGFWSWDPEYESLDIVDGTYWGVTAEHDGRRLETSGANGFPEGFERFCRAVSRLSGHAFE